jgi:hypothetical protein
MSNIRKIAGVAALATFLAGATAPASAGFFDRLFGGFTRQVRPPVDLPDLPRMSPIPGDRVAPQGGENWRPRGEGGPRTAYCVRTCDGHYFPVHPQAGFSAAQMCSTFCPASETKVYSGSGIDHAVGMDGRRYSELPQAYAYRKQLVANCTCNGSDKFGVARVDVNSDPTLRRGDVVATKEGMMVVSGKTATGAQFTAADSYRGLSEQQRRKLADMERTSAGTPGRSTEGRAPSDR